MDKVLIYWMKVPEEISISMISSLKCYLNDGEVLRYSRYLDKAKAIEFLLGRALLKWALAKRMGISFNKVILYVDEYGKLFQKDYFTPFFNLTHSGKMIACILKDDVRVGIDLEFINNHYSEVIEFMFTNEEKQFVESKRNLRDKQVAFYLVWTRKEAYLKAVGKGFSIDPKTINIPLSYGLSQIDGFSYYSFQPHKYYLISLALEGILDLNKLLIKEIHINVLENSINSTYY